VKILDIFGSAKGNGPPCWGSSYCPFVSSSTLAKFERRSLLPLCQLGTMYDSCVMIFVRAKASLKTPSRTWSSSNRPRATVNHQTGTIADRVAIFTNHQCVTWSETSYGHNTTLS
jgi:hypothetical protein